MSIKVFTLTLLVALVASQQYSISQCDCSQLLSEEDCKRNDLKKCQWDTIKKICKTTEISVNPVISYAKYCDKFNEIECPKQKPCSNCGSYAACAWVEGQCTQFTDCIAFAKTTDSECQAISNKCITDGTHCVEIDNCDKYKKQQPCVKSVLGSLCYWDQTNNSCVDADTCDKLPKNFQTDKECRDALQNCTAKSGGGCIDSGNNCSDQNLEIQCVWDKFQKMACFWNGTQCKDKICDNAPNSYNTDDACKLFKADGSCTTKANGGCITRTTCSAASIQAACIKNSTNEDCYWNGTVCVDKICSNAPSTLTTNSACASFLKGCITKQGGGCVLNGDCSVANISIACVKNSNNSDCIWDSTCKDKTCENAPKTNITHDQCTSYLPTCTVQSGGGCQKRTCINAPTSMTTNDECETYYPGNKCITKNGGGCITNTICSLITIDVACIKNSLGLPCFWDTVSRSCKDKICVNAPSTNNNHDLCQSFLNTCTVNSTNTGCVEKTCENSLTLQICDKDFNNNICIWKAKCYKKQCALASTSITSHNDCQTYHSTCTLSNTGKGCVTIPLKCEAITIEHACKIKANKQSCGWTGSLCIDKACSTAPKTISTTSDCQTYLSSCVANNPITINGTPTIQGCQDLPKTCDSRKSSENCYIIRAGFPTCFWDSSSIKCVEKSCITASLVGTPGALSNGQFTFDNCQNYLSICVTTNKQGSCTQYSYPCISNNSQDGCIAKSTNCSSLINSNCKDGSKTNGDCYWNGSNCVDKLCTNIILTSHNDCYGKFNQCTVNDDGTACLQLASTCTSYKMEENCKITSTQKNCYWTGTTCRNAICDDTPDTNLFDTDDECLNYQTQNETCTIIAKVGAQGCVQKQTVCSNYKTSTQCHKTLSNLTAQDDCKWINERCYSLSTFATGACSTFKGTQSMCQAYRQGCTNVANANSSTACTLDCTLKVGSGLTFQNCQALDPTCSVKTDGSGCIVILSTCAGYTTNSVNCYKSNATGTQANCVMNTASPPTCQAVTQGSECLLVNGWKGLDHAKCQAYNIACTSLRDGIGCQEFKANCTAYPGIIDNCTFSQQGRCYFDGTNCIRFSNCSSITGTNLTDLICSTYNSGCTVNKAGTSCQDKRDTCDLYLSQGSCTISKAAQKASQCIWSGTACLAVTTVANHCVYITGNNLTDAFCATYNDNCTVNYEKTACQEKKVSCGLYLTKSSCTLSQASGSAGNCIWYDGGCRIMTSVITICESISGFQLTSSYCQQFNSICAAKKDGTGCFVKKAECNLYTSEFCTTSSASGTAANCVLDGSTCISITTGSLCAKVKGYNLTESQCAAYNPICQPNKDTNGCSEKKATCADYEFQSDCSKSLASGTAANCIWDGSYCTKVTNPSIDCRWITSSQLLTESQCASYHASCIPYADSSGCQEIQSNCSSYTETKTCYKSLNEGYCAWINSQCIVLTSASQCGSVLGNQLTTTYCNGLHSECWLANTKMACYTMKTTCAEYKDKAAECSRILTSGNAGLCGWYSGDCFSVTTASQCNAMRMITAPNSGTTDNFCATYNSGCIADKQKSDCQEKKATCELYATDMYKCTQAGTSGTTIKCYYANSKCQSVTDAATQCQEIPASVSSDAICASYHANCTVKQDGNGCQERKAVCANYTAKENCSYSAAPPPFNICLFIDSNCVAVKELLTDCAAITASSGLTDSTCGNYNPTCTSNKAGTACQDKKGQCTDYPNQDKCTVSSNSKCIWRTSCISITDASTDCGYIVATNLTNDICASYNTGCTVNKQGTACQEKKATCADYLISDNCTRSSDAGFASYCLWHTTCISVSNISTECAYITRTNLTNEICAIYNPDCTANSLGTACQERKPVCSDYTLRESCSTSSDSGNAANCIWDGTSSCISVTDPATQCSLVNGKTGLQLSMCQLYNNDCVNLKDGTGCQQAKTACKDYTTSNQCVALADGTSCLWYENYCYQITGTTCNTITGTNLNHEICQTYNNSCTSVSDGSSCQDFKSTCEQYSGTTAACTKSSNAKCYLYNSNTCITILNVSTDCAKITGSAGSITYEFCQSYNLGCSVNRAKNACVQKAAQCSGYSNAMNGCYQAEEGLCIASTNNDQSCVPASNTSTCETVFLGTGNYSHANCSAIKNGCTVNGTTSCMAKTCANATSIIFNHDNCYNWLKTCTVNQTNNGCISMATKCSDQSSQCLNAIEGECLMFNSICIRKGCDTAPADSAHDDDTECSNYSQACTVARVGGCQIRTACSLYKSSLQCKLDMNDKKCFWNPSAKTCVDLACGNIEVSNLFNTHEECLAVDPILACTVRAVNKVAVPGCMARGPCSSYSIMEQCKTNANGIDCVWNTNTNLTEPACQDKSCITAPTATSTHNDCFNYYNTTTIKCTVFATPSTNGGQPVLGGCQQTATCSSYIDIEQCKINAAGEPCGWNGKECNDKSCSTAPATSEYDDDLKCRAYFNNKCTVSSDGQGCVNIPDICELMNQKQCYYNSSGHPCYWNGKDCVTKACENAPEETATAEECNNYLDGCTIDTIKCKTKICEDYALTTDAQCSSALSTCTTNGVNCVTRGTCLQAQTQAGCVVSLTGQQCEWIPAAVDSQNVVTIPAYCTIKTCNTAPITLLTDTECANYFTNCTTKSGGGCVIKSTCSAANVNAACTTALNGIICAWDNTLNKCRDKDCQDFIGATHAICQTQRTGCTAGLNGRCARVQNCEQTIIREACIEGINGPCLWIEKYPNSDGSKGACFAYTSCKSIAWNTDESCKWISNKCTTNGSNCVGITLCSEINTNGGCVTGLDGSCIQSVPALNSTDPKICKPFKSCTDAFYATHQDCQIANNKCTTDGSTGCIALDACQSYKSKPGCYINDKGPQIESGIITSTGFCTWDTTTNSCRDQICSDLIGVTHQICNSQLSTCSSDGTKCLLKEKCSSYATQIICATAVGNDGQCFWEVASATNNNTPKCRLLSCADIQNGISTDVCQSALPSCISNGTVCIPKAKCSTYTTKTACNAGGLDGLCVFQQSTSTGAIADTGTCNLMTSCSSANNDQTACLAAKDRCSWSSATAVLTSKCTNHTCVTYNALNGSCLRFFNWDKQSQQICTMINGICTATDPSTLTQNDCYKLSGYTYTWNTSTSKCQVCTKQVQPNDTINNTINNTSNNTNTASGLILTLVLGYIMF